MKKTVLFDLDNTLYDFTGGDSVAQHKLYDAVTKDIEGLSEESGLEKPHPAIFLLAASKFDVLPEDCYLVGDNLSTDIEGGNSVGMETIWIKFGGHKDEVPDVDHQMPDHTIYDLREVLEIVG